MRCIPGVGLYFSSLHILKTKWLSGSEKTHLGAIEAVALGMTARTFSGVCMIPFTVLKTRFEVNIRRRYSRIHFCVYHKQECLFDSSNILIDVCLSTEWCLQIQQHVPGFADDLQRGRSARAVLRAGPHVVQGRAFLRVVPHVLHADQTSDTQRLVFISSMNLFSFFSFFLESLTVAFLCSLVGQQRSYPPPLHLRCLRRYPRLVRDAACWRHQN